MRRFFGLFFKTIGIIGYVVFGILGLLMCFAIIIKAAGFWGFIVSFILTPITLIAAPWYALIAWGNWIPVVVVYGGTIFASFFMGIGSLIYDD
ncbi:hypothetical protein ACFL5V_05750 [Fibrobacterota bacterium]